MADKKTFLLYHDFYASIERLNMEQRGALLTAIYERELGLPRTPIDAAVDAVLGIIELNLDRDSKNWEEKRKKLQANGRLGGRPPKKKEQGEIETNQTKPFGFSETESNQSKHVNVNVNVSERYNSGKRSGRQAGNAMPSEVDLKQLEVLRNQ